MSPDPTPRCDVPVMTAIESQILTILSAHKGRPSAITAIKIAALISAPPPSARTIRRAVSRLVTTFAQPIGSTPASPKGFYIALSAEELQADSDRWRKFGLKALKHAYRLAPNRINHHSFIGQTFIDLARELDEVPR